MDRLTNTDQIHSYRPVKKAFIPSKTITGHNPKYISISLSGRKQEESIPKKSVSQMANEPSN